MARTAILIFTILIVALLATTSGYLIGSLTNSRYTTTTTISSGTVTITTTNTEVSVVRETSVSTVTTSVTNSTSCRTTFNSIGCLTSSGGGSCQFLTDAGLMYVRILNDSGNPVEGASIAVNYGETFCAGIVTVLTTTRAPIITNASGWAVDDERYIGNYLLYVNKDVHPVGAFLSYNMSTFITIKVPSYNSTTFYEPK